MKNKNIKIIFGLIAIACIFCLTCTNSIMEKWWETEEKTESNVYYEIDFQANEGLPVPGIQHIAHNGKVAKVQAMTRDGHAFAGWFTEQTGGREWNFATDTVKSDLVLFARWASTTSAPTAYFTVTFVPDVYESGIPRANPPPPDQVVVAGSKVIEPPAMRKGTSIGSNTWFGFGGWYEDNAYTRRWNFAEDRVNSNLNLYAKWEDPPHCIVTFESFGGNPVPRTQDLLAGTQIVEPLAMNQDGYGFGGWFTDPGFLSSNQWDFSTPVGSEDITLYAKWITNEYVVLFDADGGNPAPISQRALHGTLLTSPPLMRKSGQAFLGWFTSDGDEWNFSTDTVTSNLTLSARWGEAHYVVRFDLKLPESVVSPSPEDVPDDYVGSAHGIVPPSIQELSLNRKISEPVQGNINGWSFYGWFYTDNVNFDQTNEAHRDALIPWDFDWNISLDDNNDLAVIKNNVPEKLVTNMEASNEVFTLYARWVPNVEDMVWVRKGSFMMGATGSGTSPVRPVKFETGFYMAKYLVTQDLRPDSYKEVMTDLTIYNGTVGRPGSTTPSQFKANQLTRPVDRVSWFDAVIYSNKRSEKESLTPVYSLNGEKDPDKWEGPIGWDVDASDFPLSWNDIEMNPNANGYRLPTEAEWEYAARGGNGSPGNFTYAGSSNVDDVAWYNANSGSQTHPVATKLPNGLGIYDMSGNVMEWCWDWYDSKYYSASNNNIDPKGPSASSLTPPQRVRRGGSWNNALNNMRVVARASFVPNNNTWVMGIRVVRGPALIY